MNPNPILISPYPYLDPNLEIEPNPNQSLSTCKRFQYVPSVYLFRLHFLHPIV